MVNILPLSPQHGKYYRNCSRKGDVMNVKTTIPELEALIEENKKYRFTPEIDQVLLDYYQEFADDSRTDQLTDYINATFERKFTAPQVTQHYHKIKGRE
jgi:DNA polymerase II large subunit